MPTLRELVQVGKSQGLNDAQIRDSITSRFGDSALWGNPDAPLPDLGTSVAVQGSREGPKPKPATFSGPQQNITGPIDYYRADVPKFVKDIGDLGLSRGTEFVAGDLFIPSQSFEPTDESLIVRNAKAKKAAQSLLVSVPEFLLGTFGRIAGATGGAFDPNLTMALAAPGDEFHAIPAAEAMKSVPAAKAAGEQFKKAVGGAYKEVTEANRKAVDEGILANVQPSAQRAATGMREFAYTLAGMQPTGHEEEPPAQRLMGAFTTGVQQGEQMMGGMLGGSAAMIRHPYESLVGDPVATALAALPALSGTKAGLTAGLRAIESGGGRMGSAASSLLRAGAAMNPLAQASRGAEYLRGLSNLYPEQETIAALLKDAESQGLLTPEQAGKLARQAQPRIPYRIGGQVGQAIADSAETIGAVGGGALKGAGLGALVGGPAGAVLGSGLGSSIPLVGEIATRFAPEQTAMVKRMLQDPNIQATPEATSVARDVGTEASTTGRAVANLQREMAGMVRRGDVVPLDKGEMIDRLPLNQQVRRLTQEGTLERLPENVQRGIETTGLRAQERGKQYVAQGIAKQNPAQAQAMEPIISAAKAEQEALGSTPSEREFMAGHEYPVERGQVVGETSNPHVEKIVQDIHNLQNQLGGKLPISESRRLVIEPLQNDSITLLRERGFRGKVAKNLAREIGGDPKAETAINKWLYDMTEHALSGKAISYEVHLPNGNVVTITDAIQNAVRELSARPDGAEIMNRVRGGAMEQIAKHVQRQVEDAHRARALDAEQRRFVMNKPGPNEPNKVVPGMVRRMLRGEVEPQMLQDAKLISEEIKANPEGFADLVEQSDPNNPVRPSREYMLDLAKKLETDYVPITEDVAQFMNKNGMPVLNRMYVKKGYLHTAQIFVNYAKEMADMTQFGKLLAAGRRNIVTRDVKVTINNATQNLSLASFVDGSNPMSTAAEAVESANRLRDYYGGAEMSESERYKWRAGAKRAAFDPNDFEMEAKAFAKGSPSQGAVAAGVRGVHKMMDYGHQMGDQVFKAHRFSKTYDQVMSDFASLGDKRSVTYELRGVNTTVTREGDKFVIKAAGKPVKRVPLESDALREIAAENGAVMANGLYFNMHEKPGLVMWASGLGGGAGASLVNPFIHWPLMALDLPGKKGLVSRVLAYDGTAPMYTNDPTLLARQAARAMELSGKRLAMGQAMAANLDDRSGELQKVLARTPREASTAILRGVLDPTLNARVSPGGNEWFAMTDVAYRLGLAGAAMFVDGEDFNKPPKNQIEGVRRNLFKKLVAGEVSEPADILKFISVNGGLWYDADRKSTRLNSSHVSESRMPSSA